MLDATGGPGEPVGGRMGTKEETAEIDFALGAAEIPPDEGWAIP